METTPTTTQTKTTTQTTPFELFQQWNTIENQLAILNEKAKQLRQQRTTVSTQLVQHMKNASLPTVTFGQTSVSLIEKRDYSSLTYAYLESTLGAIIPDKEQVAYIINYLKKHRDVKITTELKRDFQQENR